MKIVHTSDWHLGKKLNGESLFDAHKLFLDWLSVEVLQKEKPDLLVVSGDIYDRAVPSTESIELFEEALANINRAGVKVLITAGNHDSRIRLGTNTRFMEINGLHFRTRLSQITEPVVIAGADFDLLAYGIPYLEPDSDAGVDDGKLKTGPTQQEVLAEAVSTIANDITKRRTKSNRPIRSMIAAHAWVTGSNPHDSIVSDSERNIKIGNIGWASAGIFDGIDYVAMGHLHGYQKVKHKFNCEIAYSGSPIPYSFSEKDHEKQILVVKISKNGLEISQSRSIPVPQIRGMHEIKASVADLLSNKIAPSDKWTKIVVTDDIIPINIFDTLRREKFPHLLELIPDRLNQGSSSSKSSTATLQELTPAEVVRRFVARITEQKVTKDVAEAIDECCSQVEKRISQVNK